MIMDYSSFDGEAEGSKINIKNSIWLHDGTDLCGVARDNNII